MARVKARVPEFALSAHNAVCVAEICRQLDGLPLALELVAARVESLGVAEVAARLADRFVLAVSATRNAPARHQTLQAALDWSSGLLDEHERVLLRRLGVFVGGWTLHAAELVCAGDGLPHDVLVDALEPAGNDLPGRCTARRPYGSLSLAGDRTRPCATATGTGRRDDQAPTCPCALHAGTGRAN